MRLLLLGTRRKRSSANDLVVADAPQVGPQLVGNEIRRVVHQLIERTLKVSDGDAPERTRGDDGSGDGARALDVRREAVAAVDLDVPDLAPSPTIDEHRFGEGEQIRCLVGLGVDAEPLHSNFHQIVGLVLVCDRSGAEVSAGALKGALGQNGGYVDSLAGAVEARIRAAPFALACDIGAGPYDGFEGLPRSSTRQPKRALRCDWDAVKTYSFDFPFQVDASSGGHDGPPLDSLPRRQAGGRVTSNLCYFGEPLYVTLQTRPPWSSLI